MSYGNDGLHASLLDGRWLPGSPFRRLRNFGLDQSIQRVSVPLQPMAPQVSLFYDRYENLARAGVFAPAALLSPTPFPLSRNAGYVPDPPLR